MIGASEDDLFFECINSADGLESKDWYNLLKQYQPSTTRDKINLDREIRNRRLNPGEDPDLWLSELNRLRLKMKNLFNEDINEKSFQLIIINGLPNEYSVTQSQLEFMLDKNEELTLEDIKTHLKSRYERLGKKRHDGALSVNYRGGSGQRYGNNGSFKRIHIE